VDQPSRLFTHISKSNDALLILNLLPVLGVTSVPFPRTVMAAQLRQAGEPTAILLYNGTYLFIAICINLLWRYAVAKRRRLLANDLDQEAVNRITRQYAFGPWLYLVCFGMASVSAGASLLLNGALAFFWPCPST
jgi:uncharacterized membrane protein